MKPKYKQEVCIETETIAWISGSAFLTSGVLCDRNNDSLKVPSYDFTPIGTLQLSGIPRSFCCFGANYVFVTLPEKKMVLCCQILPTRYQKRNIKMKWRCDGIVSLDSEIYVSVIDPKTSGKEIRILYEYGNVKRNILLDEIGTQDVMAPLYAAVSTTGNIYVSETADNSISQVRCYTKHGVCKY